MRTEAHAPVHVFEVLKHTDQYHNWLGNYFSQQKTVQASGDTGSEVYCMTMELPAPIGKRELVFKRFI